MNRTLKLLIGLLAASAALAGVALAASSPSVATGGTSQVDDVSGVLHGTVNPNGSTTSYRFEWGLTAAYGVGSAFHSAGSGITKVAVTTTARDLIPGTIYHYRLDAISRSGGSLGADRTFKTKGNPPPQTVTGAVSQLSSTTAMVTGVVNPNHQTTSYWVEYNPGASAPAVYGFRTAVQTLPGTAPPLPVSLQLAGLTSGATFHYRLVAQHVNSAPQPGADASFVTYPNPRPQPRVLAKTTPRRDKSNPFTFSTSGRITRSATLPQSVQCSGEVTVRFFNKRHQANSNLFTVQPDCTFSGTTTFHRRPGHGKRNRRVHLKVLIRFLGTGYLAPANARTEFVTIG